MVDKDILTNIQFDLQLEEPEEPKLEEPPKKRGGKPKAKPKPPVINLLAALEQENIKAWATKIGAKPQEIESNIRHSIRGLSIPELQKGFEASVNAALSSENLSMEAKREIIIAKQYVAKLVERLQELHKRIGEELNASSIHITHHNGMRDTLESLGQSLEEADDLHGIISAMQNFRIDLSVSPQLNSTNRCTYIESDLHREYERGYEEGYESGLKTAALGAEAHTVDIDVVD